jgi:hypothetical protein
MYAEQISKTFIGVPSADTARINHFDVVHTFINLPWFPRDFHQCLSCICIFKIFNFFDYVEQPEATSKNKVPFCLGSLV